MRLTGEGGQKSEAGINAEVVEFVRAKGYRVYRMNAGRVKVRGGWMRLAGKNCPDWLFNVQGFFVWFEGKKPGEKPTRAQAEHHRELESRGDFVICAGGLDEFEKQFLVVEKICRGLRGKLKREETGRGS